MSVKWVKTEDCIPMVELERQFYNDASFAYLRKTIARDGFKPCYPVRAIFNKGKNRYEVFDGIHRTKVAQSLGITKIPLIDETEKLTRQQAIAEGIKANRTHAYYNAMDLAKNLEALAESLSSVRRHKSRGRPETVSLSALADLTGMSEKSVSQYLQLRRLPEEVQTLVGQGKLGMSHALVLLRLLKTDYTGMISELAQEVVSEGISRRELVKKVESIRKRGYYHEEIKVCAGCKRTFSKDRVSYVYLCPECVGKLFSGKLETSVNENRTKAMKTYLKVNNFVKKLEKNNKKVPAWLRARVEQLHQMWKEAR